MAFVKYLFILCLYIFNINISIAMTVGDGSILYDNIKDSYKVGDEIALVNYVNIKSQYYKECIKLYDAAIYKSDMGFASNLDYYFDGKNTIKYIVPDVPPSQEYFIASRLEEKINSSKFLYTKRFQIVSGGKINPMKSRVDSCNISRVSIYGSPDEDKDKINKIDNNDPKANNNTDVINAQDISPLNTTVQNPIPSDTTSNTNNNNSSSNNNNIQTSISDPDKNSSNNTKKSLRYILFSIVGILFCSLLVFGLLHINKKRKNNKENHITSTNSYTLPSKYEYNSNGNNVYQTKYSNNEFSNNNTNANITSNNNMATSENSKSPSPPINVVDPIETPSTDIKFVATTSYTPKNNNEVAISSLDIIYIVGYLDESYAQILNITTNSYGVIPVSELNKIQP